MRAVRRPGHLGSYRVAQIVVAEAAVLTAVGAATRGPLPGLVAGVVAVLLAIACFARRRRRWWLEDLRITRLHRRRRTAARDVSAGPVLAALRAIAPGLTVRDVTARESAPVGVARDDAGWFSVVALTPAAAVPLDALLGVLAGTDQPGLTLELVMHTVPAPSPQVHPASPAGSSYRQLAAAIGRGTVPAHRESSVSVRIDAHRLAEALLDHTADPQAAAELVAGLGRKVATSLRRLGVPCRVLDAAELFAALARSCDLESAGPAEAARSGEEWTHWRSARLVHRTYWLRAWPGTAAGVAQLFAWAAGAPAAQTDVALVLRPDGGGEVAIRAFVRLGCRPEDDLSALDRTLVDGARQIGADLAPLDGEHGPAAYASAPTGGGAG